MPKDLGRIPDLNWHQEQWAQGRPRVERYRQPRGRGGTRFAMLRHRGVGTLRLTNNPVFAMTTAWELDTAQPRGRLYYSAVRRVSRTAQEPKVQTDSPAGRATIFPSELLDVGRPTLRLDMRLNKRRGRLSLSTALEMISTSHVNG